MLQQRHLATLQRLVQPKRRHHNKEAHRATVDSYQPKVYKSGACSGGGERQCSSASSESNRSIIPGSDRNDAAAAFAAARLRASLASRSCIIQRIPISLIWGALCR